ncbi:MAG: hypothetical protein LBB85_03545, partial [Dysgonamonadaceae bacterium]|nr:hypothetical protein [Dysgonamonadaceae bacterium]
MKKYLIYAFLSLALFCPRAMQAQTPGGISNATPIVWLTPDTYANGTWTNKISGTVGDFINPSGTSLEKPGTITSYNFHPAVVFTKSSNNNARNRLESQNTRNIGSDNNITAIFVHKRKTNGYAKHDFFSFNYNSGDNGHIVWNNGNANNNQLTVYWPATTVNFEQNRHNEGILTVDINNSAGSRIESYLNGVNYQSTGNHGGKVSYNTKWVLGAGYSNSYGYEGEVQEVIILKSNDTSNRLTVTDRQKIHSYLAIKYGITLNNDNYVNSDNYAVWNRTTNNGYNNNIFGIGRDNAAGLNQVQSCSQNSDMLTIYKGAFNTTNNNNSTALSNKTFLMLGANGESGNIAYNYSANTPFLNGNSADKVNYRSSVVYKAQVTTAGTAGGSQTVNINVASRSAKYVLVSANAAFPPASTRIYPINAFTAANVLINNGDMVAIAGFQTTPGDSKAVIFFTWLTPESYNNGVWKNLMGDGIGDFTQTSTWNVKTPPTKILGANYHQATSFVPQNFATALNRLISKNGINISNNDAFTFILVYNAMNAGFDNQNILNFAGGTEWNLTSYSLGYNNNNNNNTLAMGWPTTLRSLGQVPWNTPVLVTVDNSNGQITTNGIRHYLDGSQIATATSASGSVNNAIVLGGSYYDLTGNGERGFKGHIQEVIMLKRPKASASFLADVNSQADFKKIHTYLAIKYGISMNSDYMASNGTVIWNNSANTGYNNHIFGIGNDEKTGLHQKQSVSASNQKLKIYVGNKLETLNSENNGVIPDGQYLIIGSNGATNYPPVSTITTGTQYENDVIGTELNFWSGAIYKAQLTGVPAGDSFKVNVLAGNSYKYAFVSKTANFIAGDTRIYTVNALGIATIPFDNMHPYIRFVGYSSGPGDVLDGLSLWLRADDPNMLTIQNVDKSDPTVSGYPDATTENTLPAITEWTDYIRNMNYTYSNAIAGASGSNVKKPVYKAASPEMNFHPAIRFYSHESSSGSYLRNNTGILSATERNQHTAIFVTNNNFTDNAWVYPMSFG